MRPNGKDSTFTKTLGVRIQKDEAEYIKAKAKREKRSIASIIRDYVSWGIEEESPNAQ